MIIQPQMRILHCGKFFPPDRGGIETFLDDLVHAQVAAGDIVQVLVHAKNCPSGTVEPMPGFRVQRASVPLTLGGYAPVAPAFPLLYFQALRRFRPDVIHVHAPNGAALWPALLHSRVPLVLHWHADVQFPQNKQPAPLLLNCWRYLEGLVLRQANVIIATSQAYLDSSVSLADHREKCRVVPLGLAEAAVPQPEDHPALRFLDSSPGLRVLAVGRLAHYKGFRLLCEAIEEVPDASLCIVGAGEDRAELDAVASGQGLRGRIHLAGKLPDSLLDACYRRSHVLCAPSLTRSEAFGMVLLEAMSRSLPCIATTVSGSGMSEVVQHGETGLLVRPGSARELAQALRKLAAEPELRARMGQAGRERFEEHYTIAEVARRIRAVYEGTLTASPRA